MAKISTAPHIIPADPGEADSLTAIAFASTRYWNYPEDWVLSWSEALTIAPDFIDDNDVWKCVSNSEIVAFYALVASDESAELKHLWVLPEYIGLGVGRDLFHHARSRAASLGASTLQIESEPNAEEFYLKMGATRIGQITFENFGMNRELPLMSVDLP